MKKLKTIYFRSWRPVVLAVSLAILAYLLYFHRLGTLLPGYSDAEIATFHGAANWHSIARDPVNAPYMVPLWLATAVLHHGMLMTRVLSAAYGVLAVLLFYALVRPWFSFRIAFLGTIAFATSAGFLHGARYGTPQIMQMSILAFASLVLWLRRREGNSVLLAYCVVALSALLCYIPGMIWFELLGFVLLFKDVRRGLTAIPSWHTVGYILLFLAGLVPLVLAGVRNAHVLQAVAGLPTDPHTLTHAGSNLLHAFTSIGLRSNGDPTYWVGHAPLLNVIELALALFGGYYYLRIERSIRTAFLFGSLVLGLVLVGLGGTISYACLVPLLYVFVTGGLYHLLDRWLRVFPRNPFARVTGIGLIVIMVFFSVLYQVRSYYVAWPHGRGTRHSFDKHA